MIDKPKKKMGRPTIYSDKLADEICERIMLGESLNSICRDDGMPNKLTVCRWLLKGTAKKDNDLIDFCNRYEQARRVQAEIMSDDIIDISDNGTNDFVEKELRNGTSMAVCDHENINRSKLRVDSRKWIAEKLLPKKFGARQDIEIIDKTSLIEKLNATDDEQLKAMIRKDLGLK
jgi:hypothetical protein